MSPLALRKVSSVTFFRLALLACSDRNHSVLGQGDQLLARRGLDGQVDHAHRVRGSRAAVLAAQLVGRRVALQYLPRLRALSVLIFQVRLQELQRAVLVIAQRLGRDRLADLLAAHFVNIELGDVVDVPLDRDLLVLVVAQLVVRVEDAELGDALAVDRRYRSAHQQHCRVLAGRRCLLEAWAVGEHLARCDPLLARVGARPRCFLPW